MLFFLRWYDDSPVVRRSKRDVVDFTRIKSRVSGSNSQLGISFDQSVGRCICP